MEPATRRGKTVAGAKGKPARKAAMKSLASTSGGHMAKTTKKAKAPKARKAAKPRKAAKKSVAVKDLEAKAPKSRKAGMTSIRRRLV